MSKFFYWFYLFLAIFSLARCAVPSSPVFTNKPIEQPLSLTDSRLKSCVFRPQARIAHFPMYHFPPSGKYDTPLREKVAKSQFQLLHTISNYFPDVAVFDENVTTNVFGPGMLRSLKKGLGGKSFYERADGEKFYLQDRFYEARNLFHAGIPPYYDQLGAWQKEFLFQTGAPLTLYFLGHIRQVHKVIEPEDFQFVLGYIKQQGGVERVLSKPQKDYYIFTFREEKLKLQVIGFFNINPSFQGISLIAYGARHDFTDDFTGFPFEDGISCLQWDSDLYQSPTVAFPAPLNFK